MDNKRAFSIACHPDDAEFMMVGTLLRLADAGWEIHYLNIANGSCGTAVDDRDTIVAKRTAEARRACESAGFVFHEPLADDLMVYHTPELVAKVASVVRKVRPAMVFTTSPNDYMEDHQNACRLAATAVFVRGMKNAAVDPVEPPFLGDCAVYHAMPYGLHDALRNRVIPEIYVDVGAVLPRKRAMLECHVSQKEWLDISQGLDAYQRTMEEMTAEVGKMSGCYAYAEGWRRRGHFGYTSSAGDNPLADALPGLVWMPGR